MYVIYTFAMCIYMKLSGIIMIAHDYAYAYAWYIMNKLCD